jgi:hypothetical protein
MMETTVFLSFTRQGEKKNYGRQIAAKRFLLVLGLRFNMRPEWTACTVRNRCLCGEEKLPPDDSYFSHRENRPCKQIQSS